MRQDAERSAERAAREAYGRLLALLASRSRDIAAAEDALADAFLAALQQWPREGVPRSPEAWLLTTARRRLIDGQRRRQRQEGAEPTLALLERAVETQPEEAPWPDRRLELLFVCAHPAIDARVRTALMLQVVLGLSAETIASAMRVAPKTMGQRLWRAKNKTLEAGIAFELPTRESLPERLDAVLDAIYAAYGSSWEDLNGDDASLRGLDEEALWLAALTTQLLPEEAEARGLYALLLYAEARRAARRDPEGRFVPLSRQNPKLYRQDLIAEAEAELKRALPLGQLGPYQLEAAIQSAHLEGRRRGTSDDAAIAQLYEGLVVLSPTLGARVAHAAALAKVKGAAAGLDLLRALPSHKEDYQPYWVLYAELQQQLGEGVDARRALERALGLSEDAAIRRFLLEKLASTS